MMVTVALLAGGVIALASHARSSGVGHYRTRPAAVTAHQVTVTDTPLTAAERRSINGTLDVFIPAALRRNHAARGSGNPVKHLNQNWNFLPLVVISAPLLLLLAAGPLLLWRGRRRRRPSEPLDDYYTAMRRVRDDPETDAADVEA